MQKIAWGIFMFFYLKTTFLFILLYIKELDAKKLKISSFDIQEQF